MRARGVGTYRVRRNGPLVARLFEWLVWLTTVLLVFEVVRANQSAAARRDWPWNVHLLGVSTTAGLLVTALAMLLLRDHLTRLVAPTIRYVSQWASEPDGLTRPAAKYRQVLVSNAGPGTAVVVGVTWRVAVAGRPPAEVGSMVALRALLASLGLEDGADYAIDNYSPGTALAPGEEREYFEGTDSALEKFDAFDAEFDLESLVGDRYHRTVSLVPRPGASAVAAPGP